MSTQNQPIRPTVLDNVTSTQMDELVRAIDGSDQPYFNRLTRSYGWDQPTAQAVWQFMTHRITQGEIEQAFNLGNEPSEASPS